MKRILNIGILLCSVSFVYLIHKTTNDLFTIPYYTNDYVEFDKWSIIHVLSTTSLALYYPYPLSISNYLCFVFGWEFIENYFLPFWNPFMYFCVETKENIRGYIISAIPGLLILITNQYKNKIS
tara:strand:+ start:1770 stop:2141 length:372 start_codon:yes stop_codon:yes gene_type:complete